METELQAGNNSMWLEPRAGPREMVARAKLGCGVWTPPNAGPLKGVPIENKHFGYLAIERNEVPPQATAWVNLANTVRGERNQPQKPRTVGVH